MIAPLDVNAPTQPELSAFDCDTEALLDDVAAYMHTDALLKRQTEAVQHPVPALGSLRKGDCVRVRTSNAAVPFVGRVDRLTWDGRVCVVNGTIRYWTCKDHVTVLKGTSHAY